MAATPTSTAGTGAFDPTFNYYPGLRTPPGTSLPLRPNSQPATVVARLFPRLAALIRRALLCEKLNLPLTGHYVVLGIGPRCNMVGKTMASPPVHFGDTPVLNPEFGYERLCAVFEISDTANPNFTTAILVAVGPIHDNGLGTTNDELQNWFELQQNGT